MTKPRGISLGTKLVLTMVAVIIAAVGTSAFYSLTTLNQLAELQAEARRSEGERALKQHTELILRNLATSAALSILESDTPYLEELGAKVLTEFPSIEWIEMVYDQNDQVMVRLPRASGSDQVVKDELYERLRAEGEVKDAKGNVTKGRTRDVIRISDPQDPTRSVFGINAWVNNDHLIGRIRVSMSTRELQQQIAASVASARAEAQKSARNQLLFAGIILLGGILVAVLLSRRIARPLQQLSLQAGYIAGGDFAQRVEVKSRDEIGQLADSFNTMAESLGILLYEMAGKASLERELELARNVQEMMSPPPKLLPVGDFSLSGTCEMAEQCGGDWWTYRSLTRNRLLVVVGDVTGHGLPAAMIAATARGAVEALSMIDDAALNPSRMLQAIDQAIQDVKTERFMTCLAVLLDPGEGKMFFANAGHTFPYIVRPDQKGAVDLQVLALRGNPLGTAAQLITTGECELRPEDMLVLSTDGLTDRVAITGERFGEKRLRRILTSREASTEGVETLRERIVSQVHDFGAQAPLDDDMTLIICQYTGKRRATSQQIVA